MNPNTFQKYRERRLRRFRALLTARRLGWKVILGGLHAPKVVNHQPAIAK